MKRKASKRKSAKPTTPKRGTAPLTIDLPKNLAPPEGTTSGCFIRSLVMLGKGTDEILELVHRFYKGSTARGSDVSWNRRKLKDGGFKLPDAPKAAKAAAVKKSKPAKKAKRKAKARRKTAAKPEPTPAVPATEPAS